MYEKYYGLKEKPFSIQPDPDFLFLGFRHSLAYASLEYAIDNRAAFCVLSGEIGCGKTMLIRELMNRMGRNMRVGLINSTRIDEEDLLPWVLLAFGQPYEGRSRIALADHFQQFLITEYGAGRRTLLIIDEAQSMSPGALESLRLLSNINADKDQLLQMILVGQPQLKDLLSRPGLEQFRQRVAVDFHLAPLDEEDVALYIAHRLEVAGGNPKLFTLDACMKIAAISRGVPRTINILCDTTMTYGFAAETDTIGQELVDEVLRDRSQYGVFSAVS